MVEVTPSATEQIAEYFKGKEVYSYPDFFKRRRMRRAKHGNGSG